jgi:exosome complex component RRP43
MPTCTFSLFFSSTPTLLADPTSFEEPLLTSTITIVVDAEGGVVSVERGMMGENDGGEGEVLGCRDSGTLDECVRFAKDRAVVLHKLLE